MLQPISTSQYWHHVFVLCLLFTFPLYFHLFGSTIVWSSGLCYLPPESICFSSDKQNKHWSPSAIQVCVWTTINSLLCFLSCGFSQGFTESCTIFLFNRTWISVFLSFSSYYWKCWKFSSNFWTEGF